MKVKFFSNEEIQKQAQFRPPEYRKELLDIAQRFDRTGVWIDKEGVGYKRLYLKYRSLAWGTKLWVEIHTKNSPNDEWLRDILRRLPNGHCQCRKHFAEILTAFPPRYDDWFACSVKYHNMVNKALSKPEMSLEDATKLWVG